MSEGDKKQCPICDTLIDAKATTCPECETDLSLFGDLDMEGGDAGLAEDILSNGDKSLDEILAMVTGPGDDGDALDSIASMGADKDDEPVELDLSSIMTEQADKKPDEPKKEPPLRSTPPEPSKPAPKPTPPPAAPTPAPKPTPPPAAKPAPAPKPTPPPAAKPAGPTPSKLASSPMPTVPDSLLSNDPAPTVEQFECPICDTLVNADATFCPSCNAQFVEEEPGAAAATQFECPICKTLVNDDAVSCPGCGARFVEEEPAEPAQPEPKKKLRKKRAPVAPAAKPKPAPIPAAKPAPIPAAKPTPAPIPATEPASDDGKELSFVERMRMMREKKEAEAAGTAPPVAPAPVHHTVPKPAPAPVTAAPQVTRTTATDLVGMTDGQLYRRLSSLVTETKPLMTMAKKAGVDIRATRNLIGKAITAGKSKDYRTAVLLVEQAKGDTLEFLGIKCQENIKVIATKLGAMSKLGMDIVESESLLMRVKTAYDQRKYQECANLIRDVEYAMPALPTVRSAPPARAPVAKAPVARPAPVAQAPAGPVIPMPTSPSGNEEATLGEYKTRAAEAQYLGMVIPNFDSLLTQAEGALMSGDASGAAGYLVAAKTEFDNNVPPMLHEQLGNSKPLLLEAKMIGANITGPVSAVKEANLSLKRGNYMAALKHLKKFRESIDKLRQ